MVQREMHSWHDWAASISCSGTGITFHFPPLKDIHCAPPRTFPPRRNAQIRLLASPLKHAFQIYLGTVGKLLGCALLYQRSVHQSYLTLNCRTKLLLVHGDESSVVDWGQFLNGRLVS
jgi:hypothetical protein